MDNYKPNSHKYKQEQKEQALVEKKKVEKVVSGEVKTKKNFLEGFIAEDAKSVGRYVLIDVVIPTVKKAIVDSITEAAHRLFFGGSSRASNSSTASRVSYRSFYDSRYGDGRTSDTTQTRTGYSYDTITIDNRAEAEEVLVRMDELIETYGMASVADLYDLVGVTCEHTDNKYGWTNLRNAKVVRLIGGGYKLELPKALPFNK